MYQKECAVISCDNMNKVNVSSFAVSRYHQIGKFFPVDDRLQYQDHNFSYRNSKIISSGYMILTRKHSGLGDLTRHSQSLSPQRGCHSKPPRHRSYSPPRNSGLVKRDKHHLVHQVWPWTGPLFVFNRASKFHSSTCLSHASDLKAIFKEVRLPQKHAVPLIVDGGPDQSPSHMTNFLLYGRL